MNIAILGLGAMGSRVAENLLSDGHRLWVWNRSPQAMAPLVEKGAVACASAKDAAGRAEIVIAMVTDDEASQAVWLDQKSGALLGIREGCVAVESSTTSPGWCAKLALAAKNAGCDFLEAPVVGSRPQAQKRELIYLAAGEEAAFERMLPLLKSLSGSVNYIGGTGSAMAMKLAVNALFSLQVAVLGEVLGFTDKCGIATSSVVDLLNQLPVTSATTKAVAHMVKEKNYAPLFPINLVVKDLNYLTHAAKSLGAEVPMTERVNELYKFAAGEGLGEENIHAITKLFAV